MPNENTGLGLKKKKARFVKGSIEAKQFMASIRKGKGIKCGGNVFDDLGKKLKETFNPDLCFFLMPLPNAESTPI